MNSLILTYILLRGIYLIMKNKSKLNFFFFSSKKLKIIVFLDTSNQLKFYFKRKLFEKY